MILHRHKWEFVNADDYTSKDTINNIVKEFYTLVTFKCLNCPKLYTQQVNGHSANQLRKKYGKKTE